jgi:hypothetical protein
MRLSKSNWCIFYTFYLSGIFLLEIHEIRKICYYFFRIMIYLLKLSPKVLSLRLVTPSFYLIKFNIIILQRLILNDKLLVYFDLKLSLKNKYLID